MDLFAEIKAAAGYFLHRSNGLDREEVLGEAGLIAAECLPKYNPKKSSRSTFLRMVISQRLKGLNDRRKSGNAWRRRFGKKDQTHELPPVASKRSFYEHLLQVQKEISWDGFVAIRTALKLKTRHKLLKALRQEYSWSEARINAAFAEVRLSLFGER